MFTSRIHSSVSGAGIRVIAPKRAVTRKGASNAANDDHRDRRDADAFLGDAPPLAPDAPGQFIDKSV